MFASIIFQPFRLLYHTRNIFNIFLRRGRRGLYEATLIPFCYFLTDQMFGHVLMILKWLILQFVFKVGIINFEPYFDDLITEKQQ